MSTRPRIETDPEVRRLRSEMGVLAKRVKARRADPTVLAAMRAEYPAVTALAYVRAVADDLRRDPARCQEAVDILTAS